MPVSATLMPCVQHLFDSQSGVEENGLEIQGDDELNPLIRLAHVIIRQAVRSGASEIHVEPRANRVNAQFRIDGELHEVLSLPGHLQRKLIARLRGA